MLLYGSLTKVSNKLDFFQKMKDLGLLLKLYHKLMKHTILSFLILLALGTSAFAQNTMEEDLNRLYEAFSKKEPYQELLDLVLLTHSDVYQDKAFVEFLFELMIVGDQKAFVYFKAHRAEIYPVLAD